MATDVKDEPKVEEPKAEGQNEEVVTLARKEYEELLTRLADIDAKTQMALSKRDEGLEEPSDTEVSQPAEGLDFSQMSQKDVIDFVATQLIQPVVVAIETARIKTEIKDVEREYKDAEIQFKDVREGVKDFCIRNPKMSVEEAYLQVVATKNKDRFRGEKKENITPPKGEKSGISSSTAKKEESFKTVKEAAARAYEDIVKE